jgi:hypothetical protein
MTVDVEHSSCCSECTNPILDNSSNGCITCVGSRRAMMCRLISASGSRVYLMDNDQHVILLKKDLATL